MMFAQRNISDSHDFSKKEQAGYRTEYRQSNILISIFKIRKIKIGRKMFFPETEKRKYGKQGVGIKYCRSRHRRNFRNQPVFVIIRTIPVNTGKEQTQMQKTPWFKNNSDKNP